MKNKTLLAVILLTLIGAALHFYNLLWGAPFYFHPDERNIIYSVTQLSFPHQMNPHFFAYGTIPIYSIYFASAFIAYAFHLPITFDIAVMVSRIFSAFFATLLIPIMYALGKKLANNTGGLIGAFLTTFSVGLIQYAHFGTFEMWLTFFTVLLLWISLNLTKKLNLSNVMGAGILMGILIGIKVSGLALLPLPFFSITLYIYHHPDKRIFKLAKSIFFYLGFAVISYFLTNPYVIGDFSSFINSMNYESSVAMGSLPVFYSGGFYNTIPVLYQLTDVLPFILSISGAVIVLFSLGYFLVILFQQKKIFHLILFLFFCITLFPQSVIFVKWTRYIIPTLPLLYLFCAIAISEMLNNSKIITKTLIYALGICTMVISILFLNLVYNQPDSRIAASLWAKSHIPENSTILSESYDLGIVPFNQYFPDITLFNTYDLDSPNFPQNSLQLTQLLTTQNYVILPSQRVIKNRLLNPHYFPHGYSFYSKLANGSLGFRKIYQTPCDISCKIVYGESPIFGLEETTSVFDRPTVYIFKKTRQMTAEEYEKELD